MCCRLAVDFIARQEYLQEDLLEVVTQINERRAPGADALPMQRQLAPWWLLWVLPPMLGGTVILETCPLTNMNFACRPI